MTKILLVEDSPDDEFLIVRQLRKNNISNEVVVLRDGVAALDYLFLEGEFAERSNGENPTLMILDLKLPKIDGFEVLERVRSDERTKLLPVVVLTSSEDQKDILECYSLGANAYVQKPVDFTEFSDAVHQLNLFWTLTNKPPPDSAQ